MDGSTNLVSTEMIKFFNTSGVRTRLSSAPYPHSNGRAEASVRMAKRVIQENTRADGSLDMDEIAAAILQNRNTSLREGDRSPTQMATGRQVCDSDHMEEGYYKITRHWQDALTKREMQMSQSTKEVKENYNIHVSSLSVLPVGSKVAIQDVKFKCWDRSGIIVEANNFRQYVIKVEGY